MASPQPLHGASNPFPRHGLAGNGAGKPPRFILSRVLSMRQRTAALYGRSTRSSNSQIYRLRKALHTPLTWPAARVLKIAACYVL